jgi:hypothetical protein
MTSISSHISDLGFNMTVYSSGVVDCYSNVWAAHVKVGVEARFGSSRSDIVEPMHDMRP